MSLHSWDSINHNLVFADNLNQAPVGEPAYDKLYNVCPLLTSLLENFQVIPKDENHCVDEQIIPFKENQPKYKSKQPKHWAYKKIIVLAHAKIKHILQLWNVHWLHLPMQWVTPLAGLGWIKAMHTVYTSCLGIIKVQCSKCCTVVNFFQRRLGDLDFLVQ